MPEAGFTAPLGLHLAISVKLIVLPARANPTDVGWVGKEGRWVLFSPVFASGELWGSPGDDNFLGVSVGGRKVESAMRITVDVVVVVVVVVSVDDATANASEALERYGREVSRHWLVE